METTDAGGQPVSGTYLETFLSGMETAKFTQETSGMEVP